jgi:hypothetical protein
MNLTISLSEKLDAALKAHARATGISEAGFVEKVLEQVLDPNPRPFQERALVSGQQQPRPPLSTRIREIWSDMPDEALAEYPEGGAYQIDHHVYGLPKR